MMRFLIPLVCLLAVTSCGAVASPQETDDAAVAEVSTGPEREPDWTVTWEDKNLVWEIDANSVVRDGDSIVFNARTKITAEFLESESDLTAEIDCNRRVYRNLQQSISSGRSYLNYTQGMSEWEPIRQDTPRVWLRSCAGDNRRSRTRRHEPLRPVARLRSSA